MKLQWTNQFKKDYHKLPQSLQKRTDKALGLLLQDWRHKSLRAKKMKGKKEDTFVKPGLLKATVLPIKSKGVLLFSCESEHIKRLQAIKSNPF